MNLNFLKNNTIRHRLLFMACFLFLSFFLHWKITGLATHNMRYNWDMLGYIGCALNFDTDNIKLIHQKTYALAKKNVPPKKLKKTTTKNNFTRQNSKHPHIFKQQLPFYKSRVLYISLIYLLNKLKINMVTATLAITLFAYGAIGVLIFMWLARKMPPLIALCGTLLLCQTDHLIAAAQLSSPDALCGAIMAFGLFIALELGALKRGLLVASISLLVRPDMIVFLLPLYLCMGLFSTERHHFSKRWMAGFALSALIIFVLLNVLTNAQSWWVVFKFTTKGMNPHINKIDRTFDLMLYFKTVYANFKSQWGGMVFIYAALGIAGAWLSSKREKFNNLSGYSIALACLSLSTIGRYLLIPRTWPRLHSPTMLCLELLLISVVIQLIKRKTLLKETQAPS